MGELFRYAAFISYSSKDATFAKRLHRALESYGIPPSLGKFDIISGGRKNRIYPVFRDREELAAGHLGDVIKANLRASAALIVVCSPNAATSAWVQKEIEYFASLGRADKIFAIVADNAPLVDEQGRDATSASFPPAFRGDALSGDDLEPLAADARKGKDGFRNAWLKLVAGMIGVSPGRLIDRDKKRRRQEARRAAVAWMLAVIAVGLAYAQRPTLQRWAMSWIHYRPYAHEDSVLAELDTSFQDCKANSRNCPEMTVVSNELAVSSRPISVEEWRACVAGNGCSAYRNDDSSLDQRTSQLDAQHYASWLSSMTGAKYRLLSRAEWNDAVATPAPRCAEQYFDVCARLVSTQRSTVGLRYGEDASGEWVAEGAALYFPEGEGTTFGARGPANLSFRVARVAGR